MIVTYSDIDSDARYRVYLHAVNNYNLHLIHYTDRRIMISFIKIRKQVKGKCFQEFNMLLILSYNQVAYHLYKHILKSRNINRYRIDIYH